MIEFIKGIDWQNLGAQVMSVIVIVLTVRDWFKKNIANIEQLKSDGASLSEQAQYFRAMMKDNASVKVDLANNKIQVMELTKTFTTLIRKKDEEIIELKKDLTDLINVVKEAIPNVSKQD